MRTADEMWARDEIEAFVSRSGVAAVELSADEARTAESTMERAFATPGSGPTWERLVGSEAAHDPNAWQSIGTLVPGPSTLLVRDAQGLCAFRFERAADVVATLRSASGFVFYLVDDTCTFVLSFNDHDTLIGAGRAAEWVRELRRTVTPGGPTVNRDLLTKLERCGIDVSAQADSWREASDLLAALDAIGRAGSVVVVKTDGERPGPNIYTLVVSGGRLGENFFRKDGPNLESLLRDGLSFFIAHAER